MADEEQSRPVLTGLLALVGVALVVGLILGLAVLAGTQMLGLDDEATSADSGGQESLYLPKPQKTKPPKGPDITLAPSPTPKGGGGGKPSAEPTESETPEEAISLSAGQTEVAPMEQIDLTGVYPGGEGAILQVQRFAPGGWQDFPVTASVSNETFTTYVQTSQPGVNRFRVVDTGSGLASNEVRIKVG